MLVLRRTASTYELTAAKKKVALPLFMLAAKASLSYFMDVQVPAWNTATKMALKP